MGDIFLCRALGFLFAYCGLLGSLVAFPWSSGFVFWSSFAVVVVVVG